MAVSTDVSDAVAVLRRGGLVAFPTETVYGLGADAENVDALARLYRVKRRPASHPVIVHLADVSALGDWATTIPRGARALANECWPGPLTLVLPRHDRVPDAVTGGNATVGLRVPNQPIALALLESFGGGVAAPSANRFGRVSPTTAADVRADLGSDVDLVLDGGPCAVGVESTIVDWSGAHPVILRLGGVARARVEAIVGERVDVRTDGEIAAPGTLASHYAPSARVLIVDADEVRSRAAELVARGERTGLLALAGSADAGCDVVVLDPPSDVDDYARVLYARLREADRLGLDVLLAVVPGSAGIGAAVADRLVRAGGAR
jgi:L-threonylcarbamoyladenylate synthase